MTDETFNPILFLEAAVDEALSERPLIPEGDYIATILPLTEKSFASGTISKGDRAGQTWRSLNFRLEVDLLQYPDVQQQVGEAKVVLFDRIFLDVTDGGALATGQGQNRDLKRYREALGQNAGGQPWSFRMMEHQQLRVKVGHAQRPDGSVREDVQGVTAV